MTHHDMIYAIEAVAQKANLRYGAIASTHEGLGVAVEEFQELCDAVRANNLEQVAKECVDLAAICLRLAIACQSGDSFKNRSTK